MTNTPKEQQADEVADDAPDSRPMDTSTEGDNDEYGSELLAASDDEGRVGTIVSERYRITKLIGTGGMGAVYSAEHIHMRKQVAFKVLHREMTILPEVVARFEREAIAAGRIEHPNVVQARDFGRLEDGAYYLVLEYVEGEPLSYVLQKETFSVGRSLHVAHQIAEALAAAHEQGIVHRDLKPDNVMLVHTASGPERIKVLDFGIAKLNIHERGRSQRPLTKMGSVFGTPEYMSPEQAAGQRVDQRADLYALGIVLYRMIAGVVPFRAKELNAVLMMQITQPPPELDKAVPESVRELVMTLLQKAPEARPQNAAEVVDRIADILNTVPGDALSVSVAPEPNEATQGNSQLRGSGTRPLSTKLDQSFLGAPIPVAGNLIPLWRLGIVLLVMVGLSIGLVSLLRSPPIEVPAPAMTNMHTASSTSATAVTPSDPELEKLLGLAFAGDAEALEELERRPAERRSVREWLALGRGRSKLGLYAKAMPAYREALNRDPVAGNDPALKKDVWAAMRDGDAVELAQDLAAHQLGAEGTDMLYQVWVETKDITPITQRARKLLQEERVRSHASPALSFLLQWREAMSCDDYRRLLPRAAVAADTRAKTLIQRAQSKNDCELPEEALEAALSALSDRAAPSFQ